MRLVAIGFTAAVLALPSAGGSDPPPDSPRASIKQLQRRVSTLETRVSKLEKNVATLRTLICLQLPSC